MQVIDPSPSQAKLMMERRARSDGEAKQRMKEAHARRRAWQGQDPRHAAGRVDSPAIRPPPYCTEFGNGDFWRRGHAHST